MMRRKMTCSSRAPLRALSSCRENAARRGDTASARRRRSCTMLGNVTASGCSLAAMSDVDTTHGLQLVHTASYVERGQAGLRLAAPGTRCRGKPT